MVREHVARIATLEAQREAAVKLGAAADRVGAIDTELQQLKQMQESLVEG
jgi:hypothetical protein